MTLTTVDHLAEALSINQTQAYALIRAGIIAPPVIVRVGRQYRVNTKELERWIAEGGASYRFGWRK